MKRFVFISLVLSLAVFTQAQDTNHYDLSDYILPDVELQTLDFSFELGGNGNSRQWNPDFETSANDNSFYQHGFGLQSDYSLYRNTRKQQFNLDARFSLGGDISKRTENDETVQKNSYVGPSAYLKANKRFYVSEKFFYGFEPEISASFTTENDEDRNEEGNLEEQNANRTAARILIPLKLGYGRIESVTDARQAIFILEALKDKGHMGKTTTKEEITAFAELISETRNRRFFDNRIQMIKELETLDGFLKQEGLVENNDISYFTTLMDYWNYGRPVVMGAGNRIAFVVAPGYSITNSVSDEPGSEVDDKSRRTFKSLQAGIKFSHAKPYGLHWHHRLGFRAFGGRLNLTTGHPADPLTTTEEESHPNWQFHHYNNLNYYPNTRTLITLGYDINYTHYFDDSDTESDVFSSRGDVVNGSINVNAYYYISPKLRLSFDSRLNYHWQDFPVENLNMDNLYTDHSTVYNFYPVTNQNASDKGLKNKFYFNYKLSLKYSLF